ncbi:CRISPR-associated helicase Cas3' [Lentzea sp. DG1S-22]|uniref:CRISPR-associated helicase Cas3' n=1 Tax=Lentzea sp. DG1S-22 TaxID=3108822 RepID=UPI002E783BBF|nr:CRISPR-associated helicase Cas3' [Lentzea sp. DG1S-22]WVH82765.1 CRISPR-associated helicase Cas3' [Lentzea sp. DG1S-22]
MSVLACCQANGSDLIWSAVSLRGPKVSFWAAWGKSAGRTAPHPLLCHVVDTTAVAARLYGLILGPHSRNELRAAFSVVGDAAGWVALLCGLHDLGKYSPTFQALNVDLAERRFPEIADDLRRVQRQRGLPRLDTPHGLVTALHMKDLLISWGAEPGAAERIAVALGGHHGYFPGSQEFRQARAQVNNHGAERWKAWRDDLVDAVISVLGLPDPRTLPWNELRVSTSAAVGLAALTTVSDWIASDERNFLSPEHEGDLEDYVRVADARADAAVARLDLQPWIPPKDTSFTGLFAAEAPRPLQSVIENLLRNRAEPTMLVVEAPTGEGKSKGALQAVATLVRNLRLAGVYVGMPTQATSHQMLGEIEAMLTHAGDTSAVRLIHSNAREFLDSRATTPTDVGADDPEDCDVAAQEWFTRKKSLLSPLGVGTVDQALKAAIRSGHVFVRLVALSNKVVVIDEVHAYDTYMSTLLDRMLMWLGHMGTSILLLSATLPSRRRDELTASWRAGLLSCVPHDVPPLPTSTAYPRVTMVDAYACMVAQSDVSELNRERIARLELVDDENVVDWALSHASGGKCVAIVHNLVNRAKTTSDALAERIAALPDSQRPQLITITGQLAASHRRTVEADLRSAFGPDGTRPPAIVVGTQVLEQSLDLDFDVMLTDMAPIDALIQRLGRVHRHDRDMQRGALTLAIAGIEETSAGPVFPRYLASVYAPMVLLRTWALLRSETELRSPDEVPVLIDAVYGPPEAIECPAGWEQAWSRAEERLLRALDKDKHDARLMYLPLPVGTQRLADMTARPQNPGNTRKSRHR